MTLREVAKEVAHDIRGGIAWIIIFREGRSWDYCTIWSDVVNEGLAPDELYEARAILSVDRDAVIINGAECGRFSEDMTADEIARGILWHYSNGYNRLEDLPELETAEAGDAL